MPIATDEAITIMAKAMETKRAELIERPIARIYPDLATAALEALRDAEYWVERWRPIDEAPKDGSVLNVWLGDADESDVQFYCVPGTRVSPGWSWKAGKFRPLGGLPEVLTTFVQPTHFAPLRPPAVQTEGGGG